MLIFPRKRLPPDEDPRYFLPFAKENWFIRARIYFKGVSVLPQISLANYIVSQHNYNVNDLKKKSGKG
jgi:hypothetical protein